MAVFSIMDTEKSSKGPSQTIKEGGEDSYILGKKIPGEKEVCVLVTRYSIILSPNFETKSCTFSGSRRKISE
jgi:hypothetical protein